MKPFFGVRAHDFGTLPADKLALDISSSGATCIQLALAKALPGAHLLPGDFGNAGLAEIGKAFSEKEISIAVLGCYIDMVTPDAQDRETSLTRFERHIDAAASLGCHIVGTETGSPIPYLNQFNGREVAFHTAVQSLERLVKYAEQKEICVGLEPVAEFHAVSSAEHIRIIVEKFKSPALGIIFDPVNLVPTEGVTNMDEFLDDCFNAFGTHIVAIHVKDYQIIPSENGLKKCGVLPGAGLMDWEGVFARLIKVRKQHVPILLEEAGPDDAPLVFAYLQQVWDRAVSKECC